MALQLPCTLELLYQINNQSVWFLIWIFKKEKFWPDLTKEVLEIPFTVQRKYLLGGQIGSLQTLKNNKVHGTMRYWHANGQLKWEDNWKDGKKDGICRTWFSNGQLWWEHHWKDGKRESIWSRW